METKLTFLNGLPYSPEAPVQRLVERMLIRRRKHKPNLNIIDGVSSSGKTTLAVHYMDEINRQCGLPPVDLSKDTLQIGTGSKDFISKLTKAAEAGLPCITFDEAGEYNKRGWNTQLNRVMDKIIDTFRAYNIIVFMVLHDFAELPKHVWSTRIVSTLIHLKERKNTYGRAYVYSQERIYWIIKYKKDAVYPEYAYNKEKSNIKFLFRNLEPKRAKQLDILSTTHKKSQLGESEIKMQGLLSMQDISEQIGRSIPWIKKTIISLKVQPERIYKKKKYFNPTIIQRVEAQIKR